MPVLLLHRMKGPQQEYYERYFIQIVNGGQTYFFTFRCSFFFKFRM